MYCLKRFNDQLNNCSFYFKLVFLSLGNLRMYGFQLPEFYMSSCCQDWETLQNSSLFCMKIKVPLPLFLSSNLVSYYRSWGWFGNRFAKSCIFVLSCIFQRVSLSVWKSQHQPNRITAQSDRQLHQLPKAPKRTSLVKQDTAFHYIVIKVRRK